MSPCPAQPNIELGSPDNSGPSCEPQVSWCHLNHGQNHPATHLDQMWSSGLSVPTWAMCRELGFPNDTWVFHSIYCFPLARDQPTCLSPS